MHTATVDNDVRFNPLNDEDNSRIRYKKTCNHCGEEVGTENIVKGFEYDKDKYVVVTEEDFEKIKTEKDRTIKILHFTNLDEISPVYFEKIYNAVPAVGGEKAYELLKESRMEIEKLRQDLVNSNNSLQKANLLLDQYEKEVKTETSKLKLQRNLALVAVVK